MRPAIRCTQVLHYYDGIQLFEGTDRIGGHYVGVFVGENLDDSPLYAVVGVSPEDLGRFKTGDVDLLTLMQGRGRGEPWYFGAMLPGKPDEYPALDLETRDGPIPSSFLPEAWFVPSLVG